MSDSVNHDRQIDYVEFEVPDVAAAKTFYSTVFGWKFEDYGPDYTSFKDGRLAGGFQLSKQPKIGGGPLIVIYAQKLSEIRQKIVAAGGRIVGDLMHFPGGCRF